MKITYMDSEGHVVPKEKSCRSLIQGTDRKGNDYQFDTFTLCMDEGGNVVPRDDPNAIQFRCTVVDHTGEFSESWGLVHPEKYYDAQHGVKDRLRLRPVS